MLGTKNVEKLLETSGLGSLSAALAFLLGSFFVLLDYLARNTNVLPQESKYTVVAMLMLVGTCLSLIVLLAKKCYDYDRLHNAVKEYIKPPNQPPSC